MSINLPHLEPSHAIPIVILTSRVIIINSTILHTTTVLCRISTIIHCATTVIRRTTTIIHCSIIIYITPRNNPTPTMTIKQKLHHKKQHNMTPYHQHQKAPHQFLTPPRNTPTIRLHVPHQRPGDIPDNQQETQPCGRCERDPLDEGRWYEAEYGGEDVGYEGVAVEGDDVDEGDGLGLGLVAD